MKTLFASIAAAGLALAVRAAETNELEEADSGGLSWTPSHTLRREGYMGDGEHQIVWGGVNATLSF